MEPWEQTVNAARSRLSFRHDKRRPITFVPIHARVNLFLRSGTTITPIERSEVVDLVRIVVPTTVAMPKAANNNTSGHDHILRGQVNWVPWFLQFKLDAHVEGIWFSSMALKRSLISQIVRHSQHVLAQT